jgi:LacI family transcriptional regulator
MAVRMKDIARDLGVSTVTVSKVLRGNSDISARTRALVLKRMRELDYQPNMFARGLAGGRSYAVGLVVPDLVHPFFGEFARSLGGALRESGLALILASSEEDALIERREVRLLLSRGVDILLVASCHSVTVKEPFPDGQGTPLLLIDRNLPRSTANFVGSNDVRVGELATQHLIEIGRRRIAHIGGQGISPALDRLAGYTKALAEAKLKTSPNLIVTKDHFEEQGDAAGYQAMQTLLKLNERPDAVFCYNDVTAMGAMKAASEAGLRIPEDVAFVGCGNLRYSPYLKIPLTSIDHATDRMGAVAASLALEIIKTPDQAPQTILLEPRLVIRASTVLS